MNLRSSVFSSALLSPDLRLQCSAVQRKRAIPPDPPQPRFDVEEGRGEPAVFLVGGPPVVHLVGPLPDERVEGLETVGGLQARPQGAEDARHRFAEPLGPIDDAEEPLLVPEPSLHQLAEERGKLPHHLLRTSPCAGAGHVVADEFPPGHMG